MWAMDKGTFVRDFQERIRPRFDWEAFDAPDVKVYRTGIQLPQQVGLLWTPCYPGADGPPAEAPNTPPLSVQEAAADPERLGPYAESVRRSPASGLSVCTGR